MTQPPSNPPLSWGEGDGTHHRVQFRNLPAFHRKLDEKAHRVMT